MNILVICGQLWPLPSNNSNILKKLLPELAREHCVHLLAPAAAQAPLPDTVDGFPVHWMTDERKVLLRRLVIPAVSRCVDAGGFSDALQAMLQLRRALEVKQEFPYDLVISSMEPVPTGIAAAYLPFSGKRILYLMDPPGMVCDEANNTPYRQRMLPGVLRRMDLTLTTPFIREALQKRGITARFREVGFPMLMPNPVTPTDSDIPMPKEKLNLLFTGWLCSEIRSPKYFLDLARHLDDRFRIVFMGKECELLRERFDFDPGAEVVTLPNQPYQVALNAMAGADILINIGNSVPVHMPSKTLEYINAGKPIVNFHKLPDCPTLHYTRRYPLCLNIFEGDAPDPEGFIRFCLQNRGRTASSVDIPECTPNYIARTILDEIGE